MDDHQVGGHIRSMRVKQPVHEALEGGRGTKQPKQKCYELVQTIQGGEGHLDLRPWRQGNLPVALGQIQCYEKASRGQMINELIVPVHRVGIK